MLIKFEQPIGPVGDVNELEYISALHQSDKTEIRRDASIRGTLLLPVAPFLTTPTTLPQPKIFDPFWPVAMVLS